MSHVRVACPDDPAARPLLDGLAAEYSRMYGEKTDGELSVREVEEFLPPRGVFLVVLSGSTTVAGGGVAPLGGDAA